MEQKANRDAFGEALLELGRENKDVVVLSGDLEDSTRAEYFKNEFPDRFFNLGISEQDIVATAAGLANEGLIVFAASFAVFLTNRAYDMLRISVCYNNVNVKLIGTHAGLTVGEDGATAQSLEDIAITRVLPNMTVLCPGDANETVQATKAIAKLKGPAYMRLSRAKTPVITRPNDFFEIGKGNVLKNGSGVTVIACGVMVAKALEAADLLAIEGIQISVVNMHTIKPLDVGLVVQQAKKTGALVVAEEHQKAGGLGSAVAEVCAEHCPVPIEFVAVDDTFGESGSPDELLEKYKLTAKDIVIAVRKVIDR